MFHIHVDHTTHKRVLLAAIDLLHDLLGESAQQITQADRPDVGIILPPSPVQPPTPMSWPQSPVQPGPQSQPIPPLVAGPQQPWGGAPAPLPLPSFVPSTAGAPTWPTAPGAQTVFSAPPGPAAPSPAPQFVPPAAAPVAAPIANPAGVALDTKGLPWDGRIHSSGKSKLDNGTWKMKKGVVNDLAFVSRIEAELRQVLNMQVPPAPAPTPVQQQPILTPPPAPAPAQQQQWQQPAPAQQQQWQQPAPTPAPMQQPPQNISGPQTFADFNAAVSAATSTGQISVTRLLEVVAELGLPSVPMLQHRPELVPIAWAKLTGQMA